jgi:CrcB protein
MGIDRPARRRIMQRASKESAMVQKLLLIGLAGGLGTLARYGLAGLVQRAAGESLPWGTAVVNVAGCLLFGVIWVLAEQRLAISGELRTILLVGFLGAFTTFSTFVSETGQLLAQRQYLYAAGNLVLQNVLGVGAFFLGTAAGRLI